MQVKQLVDKSPLQVLQLEWQAEQFSTPILAYFCIGHVVQSGGLVLSVDNLQLTHWSTVVQPSQYELHAKH